MKQKSLSNGVIPWVIAAMVIGILAYKLAMAL